MRALPAGAGPQSERAARAGRRTGRTKRRQTPNEERRANAAADSPRARGARTPRAGPTARVALGVRPRARSWCAPYPPARGLGARERRARGDGRDERNDAKPPTKSGARTRPRTHRERAARGLPAPADRARRARRASARPLVVRALPAGAGPWSERAARAGRRTGRTKRRQPPNEERRSNAAADSPRARGVPTFAPVVRARRARRASARPLVVRALPAGAGPRSERAARAGRRMGRTKRRQTPNEERRANAAADSPRARGARTPLRRPTARVALGVRPRARSWCAPYPPARGLGARERRARGDGRDERNDAKPLTKSGARTRPVIVTITPNDCFKVRRG